MKVDKLNHELIFPLAFDFWLTQNIRVTLKSQINKVINKTIVPYFTEKFISLKLKDSPTFLIIDVVFVQTKEDVFDLLTRQNVALVRFPANMMHLFQPEQGISVEQVKNDLRWTVINHLHATLLTEFYNLKKLCVMAGYMLVFLHYHSGKE